MKLRSTEVVFISMVLVGVFHGSLPETFAENSFEDWQVRKSTHFIVYHPSVVGTEYVELVLNEAEGHYDRITERLGFRRFNFWTWEKRGQIYLYPSLEDYHRDNGGPEWSSATAHIKDRVIKSYYGQGNFFSHVLPHEMGHLIFREFVGHQAELPLWLDEGIGYLQEQRNGDVFLKAKDKIHTNEWIPFEELTQMHSGQNMENPAIFYLESASLVEFLLEHYGEEKFIEFCRALRDQREWETSLKQAYAFRNLNEFNEEWLRYLTNSFQKGGQNHDGRENQRLSDRTQ